MKNKCKIAVVGATGAVGEVMLSILAERGHAAENVTALASERSVGKTVAFGNKELILRDPSMSCYSPIPGGHKFCGKCGAPIQTWICWQCQAPVPVDRKFCGLCGADSAGQSNRQGPESKRRLL